MVRCQILEVLIVRQLIFCVLLVVLPAPLIATCKQMLGPQTILHTSTRASVLA